jgi:hypothetical protein
MKTCNLEKHKIKGKTTLDEYVKGFIEANQKDIENRSSLLSFTLYDKVFDTRKQPLFGTEEYPFVSCGLKVPNKELAEQVKQRFGINYYELSLHANTPSRMHNAYCSLSENSYLIRHFANSENSRVMLEEKQEPDLEDALLKANVIPAIDGLVTIDSILGSTGIICKTNDRNKLIPLRYLEIPAKPFFNWVYNTNGLEMIENDSYDYYYQLGNDSDPKATLRRFTAELVLSTLRLNKKSVCFG